QGAAVELQSWGDAATVVFSTPENLQQVQRGSLALRRREVPTVSPIVFAHFVQRWQGLSTNSLLRDNSSRSRQTSGSAMDSDPVRLNSGEFSYHSSEDLRAVLERLHGLALPRELWEATILPSRIPDYQTRWLD